MKTKNLLWSALMGLFLIPTFSMAASLTITLGEGGLSEIIPDNVATGISRSVSISGYSNQAPYTLSLNFAIEGTGFGAINGDYYSYLQHTSVDGVMTQMAVLLNRVGVRADSSYGYLDNGMVVTLQDQAAADIHNYRLELYGSNSTPVPGALTGTWQPDGRNIDPYTVTDISMRTTSLDALGLMDPNGVWTIFFADLQAGGTGKLTSWFLDLLPIPEPSTGSILVMSGLIWLANRGRRRS